MRKQRKKQSEAGFTLIEIIVSVTLFATVVTSIVGIYIYTLQVERHTDATRSAAEISRFVSEFFSKEIRNGQLDYDGPVVNPCSTNIQAQDDNLAIVNVDGDHECIWIGNASGTVSDSGPMIWFQKGNLPRQKLNLGNVLVTRLVFYASPTCNPYVVAACQNSQPTVTILGLVQLYPNTQYATELPIETTISIPQYGPATVQ